MNLHNGFAKVEVVYTVNRTFVVLNVCEFGCLAFGRYDVIVTVF